MELSILDKGQNHVTIHMTAAKHLIVRVSIFTKTDYRSSF